MKGIVLAGGAGTRLAPLTKVVNKTLLPVYDRPMIFYPLQFLADSGIEDILIVCGGSGSGRFMEVLGNGDAFGLKMLHYAFQDKPLGIPHALSLAEEWVKGEPVVVVLGDNVFQFPIPDYVRDFETSPDGARIFLTEVAHPEFYPLCGVKTPTNSNRELAGRKDERAKRTRLRPAL